MAKNNDLYQNQYEYEKNNKRSPTSYVVADTRSLSLDARSQRRLIKMTKDAMRPDLNQPKNYINIFGNFSTSANIQTIYLEKDVTRGTNINQISNNRIVITGIYLGYLVKFPNRPTKWQYNATLNFAIYQAKQRSDTVNDNTFIGDDALKVGNMESGLATRSGYKTPSYKTQVNRLVAVDGFTPFRAGRVSNMNVRSVVTEFVDGNSSITVSGGHWLQVQHDTIEDNVKLDVYYAVQLEFFYP